jgi:molecular chaperone DnaK (HSP70)
MDVSVLWLNNAVFFNKINFIIIFKVFVTQAMAGNNRLGGQDFNERIYKLLLQVIKFNKVMVIRFFRE